MLNHSGMRDALDDLVINKEIPVLGICVGMQIMLNSSEEGNQKGLSWLNCNVLKLNIKQRIPHMGWNNIIVKENHPILNNLNNDSRFYFLHSFYCDILDNKSILSTTKYEYEFQVLNQKNIYGIQCHPEKSHKSGLIFLKNFAKI